jgi:glycosyltransferase involved in cell wall biosynthesis
MVGVEVQPHNVLTLSQPLPTPTYGGRPFGMPVSPTLTMRIAIWYNLPSGGGKRALFRHVRGLLERGHEVEAWCPPSADRGFLPLTDLIPEHVRPLDGAVDASRYEQSGRALGWRELASATRTDIIEMDRHTKLCAVEVNAGGFDVLLDHACTFYGVSSIGRQVDIPSALYLHEPLRRMHEAMPTHPFAAEASRPISVRHVRARLASVRVAESKRVQVREEIANARAYRRILVNSLHSREAVLRAYGLDSHVCYLGVDADEFSDRGNDREAIAVGIGAFVWEKNIPFIVRAISEVGRRDLRLVWVGNHVDPPQLAKAQTLAQDLKVDFEACVLLSDEDLVGLLNRASVFVYAPRLEPFGLAPLEAAACGLPAVAVAEGGARETILDGRTGFLTENSEHAFASAVSSLLTNDAQRIEMGGAAREWVLDRWTTEHAAARLEAHLLAVVGADP